jgi:hypothetical protein
MGCLGEKIHDFARDAARDGGLSSAPGIICFIKRVASYHIGESYGVVASGSDIEAMRVRLVFPQ